MIKIPKNKMKDFWLKLEKKSKLPIKGILALLKSDKTVIKGKIIAMENVSKNEIKRNKKINIDISEYL